MPSLPLDLERLIFEMAALRDIDHDSRVRLLLVAKRVYEWIRPILYRVAIVGIEPTLRGLTIRNWQSARVAAIAPFARHLLISLEDSASDVIEMLSVFCNVESFALWFNGSVDLPILVKLKELPLRVLSIGLGHTSLGEAIEHCPAFMKITHLEIFALKEPTWNNLKALVDLPKLTHVCLELQVEVETQVILDLLEHCPSLRVMICQPFDEYSVVSSDPRLLVYQDDTTRCTEDVIAEWEMSANGEIGPWELADIIIEARKDKLFRDNSSFTFSRSTWMDELNEDGRRWYEEWSRGS